MSKLEYAELAVMNAGAGEIQCSNMRWREGSAAS